MRVAVVAALAAAAVCAPSVSAACPKLSDPAGDVQVWRTPANAPADYMDVRGLDVRTTASVVVLTIENAAAMAAGHDPEWVLRFRVGKTAVDVVVGPGTRQTATSGGKPLTLGVARNGAKIAVTLRASELGAKRGVALSAFSVDTRDYTATPVAAPILLSDAAAWPNKVTVGSC
jgi:hypothetical protein